MEFGLKHGMLTYISNAEIFRTAGNWTYTQINCLCDCGESVVVRKSFFKSGKAFSCGCVRRHKSGLHQSHDHYNTQEYQSWFAMKARCNDVNGLHYDTYGGRGITYDPKWVSFHGFWDDMGSSYIKGLSIDRINPDGNYNKENCRWATKSTQAYNQRKSKNNVSGKTGVHWETKAGKWRVKFSFENNVEILGYFVYLWDAIFVRMQKEQEIYGYVKE